VLLQELQDYIASGATFDIPQQLDHQTGTAMTQLSSSLTSEGADGPGHGRTRSHNLCTMLLKEKWQDQTSAWLFALSIWQCILPDSKTLKFAVGLLALGQWLA